MIFPSHTWFPAALLINSECRPSSSLVSPFPGPPLCLQHVNCTFCCQKEPFLPPHLIHGCHPYEGAYSIIPWARISLCGNYCARRPAVIHTSYSCAHTLLTRAGFPAMGVAEVPVWLPSLGCAEFACLIPITPDEPASVLWELFSSSLNKCPPKELRPPANSHMSEPVWKQSPRAVKVFR